MYALSNRYRLHLRDRNAFGAGRCRAMTPATVQAGTGGRYSLALYDDPHSEYSSKVKVAMYAKGLSWETLTLPCGGTKSADYLRINPLGKLPALLVHDTQSNTQEVTHIASLANMHGNARPQAVPTDRGCQLRMGLCISTAHSTRACCDHCREASPAHRSTATSRLSVVPA